MRITDLMERPRSRAQLAEYYAAALTEQAESGISMTEYADEIGVSAATLYLWRRRLSSVEANSHIERSAEPELLEVVLADCQGKGTAISAYAPASLTVQLGGARAIQVSSDFDADVLQRLVRTLETC